MSDRQSLSGSFGRYSPEAPGPQEETELLVCNQGTEVREQSSINHDAEDSATSEGGVKWPLMMGSMTSDATGAYEDTELLEISSPGTQGRSQTSLHSGAGNSMTSTSVSFLAWIRFVFFRVHEYLTENSQSLASLLWKNVWLLACKRHYLLTSLQIGLPLILTTIFCIANYQFIPNEADTKKVTSFPIPDETELLKRLYDQTECLKCVVAYEPKTEFTTSIVTQIRNLYHRMLQLDEDHQIKEWKGFNSELEIQAYWLSPDQNRSVELKAAILFQEGFNISTDKYANFSYTILIPDVTSDLFAGFLPQATKRSASDSYDTTASALQILVNKVLTIVLTKVEAPKEKILLQPFPWLPAPIRNTQIFGRYFNTLFALLLSLGLVVTVPFVVGPIVREKESGMRELMHVHRLSYRTNWLGWLLYSMLFQLVTSALLLGLLFIPFNSVVGGIVKRGSLSLWTIALSVYCIASTSWCILIASFFYDPTIAISAGAFLWLGAYLLLAASPFYRLTMPWKLLLSLFPNLALSFCTELLLEFDERFEGANWGILFKPKSDVDSFTIGYALIEMLLSSILYNLLAFYFESIIPPKLGVRKPWNFIFKSSGKLLKVYPGRRECVELLNLKKVIGGKELSYGESHTFKEGEIIVLYGANGSGKTTLLSILAGLMAPTAGTAYVNGVDVTQDINSARRSLGFCPQSNILFADLTVEEHLTFFGMLKGRSNDATTGDTKVLLHELHLNEIKDVLSSNLSGGQKRKLNLAMAAIGKPKVLLLDEPTSGIDLESRYSIREFLHLYDGGSTSIRRPDSVILMTSHSLEDSGGYRDFYDYSRLVVVTDEGLQPEFPCASVQQSRPSETAYPSKLTGVALVIQQFRILIWKHFLNGWRQKRLLVVQASATRALYSETWFPLPYWSALGVKKGQPSTIGNVPWLVTQILLPLLLAVLTTVCVIQVRESYSRSGFSNNIGLEANDDLVTLYSTDDVSRKMFNNFTSLRNYRAKETKNVTKALVKVGEKNFEEYQQHYVVAAEFSSESEQELTVTAMYSLTNPSAVSEALNLASHVILRKINGDKHEHIKGSVKSLLPNWAPVALDAADPSPKLVTWISVVTSIVLPLGLAFLAASFVVMPVKEKASKVKQLQLMTGLNAIIYWGAFFSWDIFTTTVVSGFLVLCLRLLGTNTDTEGEGVLLFMFLTYGIAAIFFSYWISLKFSNASIAFVVVTIVHMVSGTIGTISIITLKAYGLVNASYMLSLLLHIFPAFGISLGVALFSEVLTLNDRCHSIPRKTLNALCNPNNTFDSGYRSCCPRCEIDFPGSTCFQQQPYIQWHSAHREEYPHLHATGIGLELVHMMALGGFYMFVLAFAEFQFRSKLWKAVSAFYTSQRVPGSDNAVSTEGAASECGIEVKDLSKSYGSVQAVSSLNFRALQKEHIGLVGHNGAGKSTLFRILTGDEIPSSGSVYIEGKDLESDSWGVNLISKRRLSKIGYCPQYQGLIGTLTGKEVLQLFCQLWGRSWTGSSWIAMEWMDRLGLKSYENQPCSTYSGGMRRRLSVALAFIGNPAIVILDEPYTGVNFEARQLVSDVIKKCEQSVIVSTHDLKECETFVSTLTIMKNGKLVESSLVENLKEKYRNAIEVVAKESASVTYQLMLDSIARELGGAVQSVWINDKMAISAFILHRRSSNDTTYRAKIKERILSTLMLETEQGFYYADDNKTLNSIYLNLVGGKARVTCFEFKSLERRCMEEIDAIANQNPLGDNACIMPKSEVSVVPAARASMSPAPMSEVRIEMVEFNELEEKTSHPGCSTMGEHSISFQSHYQEKTKLIHVADKGKIIPVGMGKYVVGDTFTVKLTNYLKPTLKIKGRYYMGFFKEIDTEAASCTTRRVRFRGFGYRVVLLSIRVTEDTTIYLFVERKSSGFMLIGGFCPDDEPQTTADKDYEVEDIRRSLRFEPGLCHAGYESFVSHRELLMRVYVAEDKRLELHIDVLDISDVSKRPPRAQERQLSRNEIAWNVPRLNGNISHHFYLLWKLVKHLERLKTPFAGIIDLENRLNVSLSSAVEVKMYPMHMYNWRWDSISGTRVPLPEVLAFTRETFYEDGPTAAKAIISYKIESMDLSLVVAFEVQDEKNLFSVALVPLSDDVAGSSLDSLLDPAQLNLHPHRKFAKASEGEQIVRTGDIRVRVSMTEGRISILSLRVYTV